jgi:hypothetical protein
MGKTFIFLLLHLPSIIFSQNLNNLDEKYGFNKFKLGNSFQFYSKDIDYVVTDKSGVKYYKYKRNDISVFGFTSIEEIGLGFYKDKLYTIDIVLNPKYNEEMYSVIFSKLKELFGYPTTITSGKDYGEWDTRTYMENINQWLSNKTLLGFNKVKCSSPSRPCTISIFLVSQIIQRQINNDGF